MVDNDDNEEEVDDWFPNVKSQDRNFEWFPDTDTLEVLKSTRLIFVASKFLIGLIVILGLYLLNNYYGIIPI